MKLLVYLGKYLLVNSFFLQLEGLVIIALLNGDIYTVLLLFVDFVPR